MKKLNILLLILLMTAEIILTKSIYSDWVQVSYGLTQLNVNALVNNGNNLYAGTFGAGVGGVFKSTNYGMNWTLCLTLSTGDAVWALDTSSNHVYAGATGGLYSSTNNGTNWNYILNKWIYSLATNGSDIFAGCKYNLNDTVDMYKSTNYGASWVPTSITPGQVNTIAMNGNNIYAGLGGGQNLVVGFFVSTNYGLNWLQTINNRTIFSLAVNGNNIFAGSNGVYLSTNNGFNWIQTSLSTPTIGSLIVEGNNVFAGGGGIWLSTDNGTAWTLRNEGMPYYVNTVYICNNFIFAGTDGHGVWRRPLGELVVIKNITKTTIDYYELKQNYPNPFNSETKIAFSIPNHKDGKQRNVILKICNLIGQDIAVLVNKNLKPGKYETKWAGNDNTSGTYFYQLIVENKIIGSKKMILIK